MMNERRYRIEPRFANLNILPLHMRGLFRFKDAHLICAEWNSRHEAEEMVIEVEVPPLSVALALDPFAVEEEPE